MAHAQSLQALQAGGFGGPGGFPPGMGGPQPNGAGGGPGGSDRQQDVMADLAKMASLNVDAKGKSAPAKDDGPVDESGVDASDIELVTNQVRRRGVLSDR